MNSPMGLNYDIAALHCLLIEFYTRWETIRYNKKYMFSENHKFQLAHWYNIECYTNITIANCMIINNIRQNNKDVE